MRGAGRMGVAGVHLEALAKGFDVRGSVAVADRSGNTACTLAVALRARPRGGVKVGHRVSIDVAMAVTDGLDDVDSGLTAKFSVPVLRPAADRRRGRGAAAPRGVAGARRDAGALFVLSAEGAPWSRCGWSMRRRSRRRLGRGKMW